jgi:uncharacterized protein (TIGR02246 family)
MAEQPHDALIDLYRRLIDGWNARDADAFAAGFAEDGMVVGFDGSQTRGRTEIAAQMAAIFADHPTGRYVGLVRDVRPIGADAAILRAVAGVVPAGSDDINPDLNTVQSLTAQRIDGAWRIVQYHNTPAAYHGRPDAVQRLSEELRAKLPPT